MAIARGSRSVLNWKQETTYGTAPGGNWNQLPFNSETLAEDFGQVQAQDMRADRRNPAIRGGNVSSGGNIVHDFGLIRELPLLRHLLAAGAAANGSTITIADLAASTAYVRGDIVKNAGGVIYLCTRGGTTHASVSSSSLTATSGRQSVQSASGNSLEFEYAAAAATPYYLHTLTAGVDMLAAGLSVEKGIIGGTENLYVVHTGCRLNTLDLAVEQESVAKATWALLSSGVTKVGASSGAGTPVLTPESPVTGFNAFVHLNNGNANAIRCVQRAALQITNQFDESVFCFGSRYRSDLPEGTRRITGSFSIYYEDDAEYDLFKAESVVALKLSFVFGGAFLEFDIPEAKLYGGGPQISGPGAVLVPYDFTAFSENGAYDIKVTARNQVQTLPV